MPMSVPAWARALADEGLRRGVSVELTRQFCDPALARHMLREGVSALLQGVHRLRAHVVGWLGEGRFAVGVSDEGEVVLWCGDF